MANLPLLNSANKTLALFFFTVLADDPPEEENITESVPSEVTVADTEMVAEWSNNMTIRCNHRHNGTVYQVIFEKLLLGHHWTIIGVCKTVEGGLVGEDYSDRGRVDCADSLDVSLHLTDVTGEDSGFYRCTFNTDVGVQTTTVQLTVSASGTKKQKHAAVSLHDKLLFHA